MLMKKVCYSWSAVPKRGAMSTRPLTSLCARLSQRPPSGSMWRLACDAPVIVFLVVRLMPEASFL